VHGKTSIKSGGAGTRRDHVIKIDEQRCGSDDAEATPRGQGLLRPMTQRQRRLAAQRADGQMGSAGIGTTATRAQ